MTNYSAESPQQNSATSASSSSPATSQRRTFDLAMDLTLLRQLRSHDQPFRRGSPAMEIVARELENLSPTQFGGVPTREPWAGVHI